MQSNILKNRKILITGYTGFVGSNLARYFIKAGADVYVFTRKTSNKWRIKDVLKELTEYQVDLLNYSALKRIISEIRPEVIIHTAVYGGFTFQRNETDIINTNLIGTSNLINACAQVGFELFINTGSSSEYGIKNSPMKEADLLEPINIYGVSKAAAALLCQEKAMAEKLPIVTLRLFSPYGYYEAENRLIPSVILSCLKSKNPKASSPTAVRDFVFIEDVISAYVSAIRQKDNISDGGIFNIGAGLQHSVGEVIAEVIKMSDNKLKPEWGTVSNPRIEPKIWQADISKAKEILDWQPQYNLQSGLEKTIKWFEENIAIYGKQLNNKGML